ncbi:MAG: DUF3604 domain-containing protein [Gammaproteobacteria bacterium]|jgi:hypothetical protein|nr:DUF3604 domain-containing protein [Gammaproteobacteria bacterium]
MLLIVSGRQNKYSGYYIAAQAQPGETTIRLTINLLALIATTAALAACGPVEDPSLFPAFDAANATPIPARPPSAYNPRGNLYWGDLHVHTSFSTDAYTMGVRATPEDAYRYFKGGEIRHAGGYGIKLKRPLDFAAVTDHAEYLGVLKTVQPELLLNKRSFRDRLLNDSKLWNTAVFARTLGTFDLTGILQPGWEAITRSAWQESHEITERHNDPGRFTSFHGYEWSSMPAGRNLHRNVIYRSAAVPETPYSSLESQDPRDLWTALEAQRRNGMDNFAIPHNSNLSDGVMYGDAQFSGEPMDAAYAARRMRNEPIGEIFQVKGSSETHPQLSPQDPFAGFEIYDTQLAKSQAVSEPRGGYIRDALRLGIEMSHSEGFNPYRFGVIGSSDGHNASAPVDEDSYHGKLPMLDGSAGVRLRESFFFPEDSPGGKLWSAAGLAAVWAPQNTRDALFDAMLRKETYATSGTRIGVRFYGGWAFPEDLPGHPDRVALAQANGVPMGGKLAPPAAAAPSFAVWAQRDPDSGNLDRIQIIKGWVDSAGQSQERIYNVAWAGVRGLDADGGLAPVGNTVDVEAATYTNTIGADALATLWTDPDFDPTREAFYYARVIEIPTPRWSTFDAKALGIKAPEPAWLQERAVTSAIWYEPPED